MRKLTKTVYESAKLLDEVCPDWYTKIKVDTLRMSSTSNCVLGQLYESYREGLRVLNFDEIVLDCDNPFAGHRFVGEWVAEIKTRNERNWSWALQQIRDNKFVRRSGWTYYIYTAIGGIYVDKDGVRKNWGCFVGDFLATDWELYVPNPTLDSMKVGQKFQFLDDLKKGFKGVTQKAKNGYIQLIDSNGNPSLKLIEHQFLSAQKAEVKVVE